MLVPCVIIVLGYILYRKGVINMASGMMKMLAYKFVEGYLRGYKDAQAGLSAKYEDRITESIDARHKQAEIKKIEDAI